MPVLDYFAQPHRPHTACTGLSARWCPNHGDCTCPYDPNTWRTGSAPSGALAAPDYPLHSLDSDHAEPDPAVAEAER